MSTGKDFVGVGPVRDPHAPSAPGWKVFSALGLMLIGIVAGLQGLNLGVYDAEKLENVVGISDPDRAATILLVVGVLVFAAGLGVFSGARWARVVGIAAVFLAVLVHAWFLISPIQSAAGISLNIDLTLLFALTVKWEGKSA
jgi:hypothetical protein